ncbi:MAG: SH3 domain-containing protein [Patescibacteria group bacterium]
MPKNLRVIYQVYTLIAATVIFLSSLLLLNGPVRTANLIVITPLVALAWINLTDPRKTSESIWSLRMLIVVFCLSLLGLFAFKLSLWPKSQPECPVCLMPSPILIPAPSLTQTPASTDFVLGSIIITSQNAAKIYAEPNLNSQIIGTADYNNIYPYLEFEQGFFKIIFNSTNFGWVNLEAIIPSP